MNINSIKFTRDNTEGFNQEILDKMNAELETAIENLDKNELGEIDKDELKHIEKQIFDKYC